MNRLSPVLALFALLAAAPATAQEIPVVQRGADGRFEAQIDGQTAVSGFASSRVASFRGRITDITDMFAAIPAVNAPAAPICRRVYAHIADVPLHGVLAVELGVMTPINFQNGRCNRMTGGGVAVTINLTGAIMDHGHAFIPNAEGGDRHWYAPPFQTWSPSGFTLARGITVLTRSDRPLYLPVSLERFMREKARREGEGQQPVGSHLARFRAEELPQLRADSAEMLAEARSWATAAQIAEMRRMHEEGWRIAEEGYARMDEEERGAVAGGRTWTARLADLEPRIRANQACILRTTGEPSTANSCVGGDLLWELNPDYFDTSRPDEIQLIVIESPDGPYHGESAAQHAGRLEILRDMNLSAFAPR